MQLKTSEYFKCLANEIIELTNYYDRISEIIYQLKYEIIDDIDFIKNSGCDNKKIALREKVEGCLQYSKGATEISHEITEDLMEIYESYYRTEPYYPFKNKIL